MRLVSWEEGSMTVVFLTRIKEHKLNHIPPTSFATKQKTSISLLPPPPCPIIDSYNIYTIELQENLIARKQIICASCYIHHNVIKDIKGHS